MIEKDIASYGNKTWVFYRKTASELSANEKGEPLVKSPALMYSYDDIVGDLFKTDPPKTADALYIYRGSCLFFIEFKRLPRSRMTRDNQGNQKNTQRKEIVHSLRMKGIESYVVLERAVFPLCGEKPMKLIYLVVKNEDPVSGLVTIQQGMSGKSDIENALGRLKKEIRRGSEKVPYIYDNIRVMTSSEFDKFL